MDSNLKIILATLAVAVIGVVIYLLATSSNGGLPNNGGNGEPFNQDIREVMLYYYDPEKDKDEAGNILCSEQGLVPVERTLPVSLTPIQDTINLLLDGNLTQAEQGQGIETEYPLPGLELEGADLDDGHLTLEFNDPQNKTVGGSCRVSILWQQIEATAKQFPEVDTVGFTPADLFQP